MNSIVIGFVVFNLIQLYARVESQDIQNATPINVDLGNPSEANFGSSDSIDNEGNLGGYRPLYPPYFPREPLSLQKKENRQAYFDKDYYTRDSQVQQPKSLDFGQSTSQLLPNTGPPTAFQPTITLQPLPVIRTQQFARAAAAAAIPTTYQVRTEFAKSGSVQVKSSYSFSSSSVRFPNS